MEQCPSWVTSGEANRMCTGFPSLGSSTNIPSSMPGAGARGQMRAVPQRLPPSRQEVLVFLLRYKTHNAKPFNCLQNKAWSQQA